MVKVADLAGQTIGQLTVLCQGEPDHRGATTWRCRCSCGTEVIKLQWVLEKRKGHLTCGCRQAEYRIWVGMIWRCSRRCTGESLYIYYARGIRVCERWQSFDAFYEDMGSRPGPEMSIDRIDSDGDYEKSNCRWATPEQQLANRRPPSKAGFYTLAVKKPKSEDLDPSLELMDASYGC